MKTIQIRQGNDTPITLALTRQDGTPLDLRAVQNLKLSLIHEDCGRSFEPIHRTTEAGAVTIEFNADEQAHGFYHLHIEGDIPSEDFEDKLQHIAYRQDFALEVLPTGAELKACSFAPLKGVISAYAKGDKGERGERGEQGPRGVQGERGEQGPQGLQGEKGDPFRYEDFTPEQLEALKPTTLAEFVRSADPDIAELSARTGLDRSQIEELLGKKLDQSPLNNNNLDQVIYSVFSSESGYGEETERKILDLVNRALDLPMTRRSVLELMFEFIRSYYDYVNEEFRQERESQGFLIQRIEKLEQAFDKLGMSLDNPSW